MPDDNGALLQSTQSLPATVVQQPDPMLDEQPVGWFRVTLTAVGGTAVVALVLYGLTRPPEPQQIAASEPSQTAPAGGGTAGNGSGQAPPANAAAQNPQPNAQAPTTTGQGSGGGQAGQSKAPPSSGSSAGSDTGPGAKPAPAAK
jgi:hypothetical protein